MAQYALRVPESLFAYAREVSQEEQVSMNQFFVTAIAEKVSALKTETYFKARQARARALAEATGKDPLAAFDAWMAATPSAAPSKEDQL